MSYNKHTWATGNVVGAVDLNRMEQGIEDSGNILIVEATFDGNITYTLNKTWQEIYDAFPNVKIIYNGSYVTEEKIVTEIGVHKNQENGYYFTVGVMETYFANLPTDYPSRTADYIT